VLSCAMLSGRYPEFQLGADTAVACSHVRLLGVDISSDLSLDHHVSGICAGCYYRLLNCVVSGGSWTPTDYCRTTVSRPPVLTLGDSCVPTTVNVLQCHVTGSILMVAGPFQLSAHSLDFIRDPTISADRSRRLIKTYLFARY